MTDHYPHKLNLRVSDEGYGGYYDPGLGLHLEKLVDDDDVPFSDVMDIEHGVAARLSLSYNLLRNVPLELLSDTRFELWIADAAERFYGDQAFFESIKNLLGDS